MMVEVKKGQDPYSVIGQYIRDHVEAIEDMIAVIEINGKISNELFMVDMDTDGYFVWDSDWYEGEENIALIDFFPVSDAINPKAYREKGTYTESGENDEWYCWYATCNECVKEWMGSRNFCPNCGKAMKRGERDDYKKKDIPLDTDDIFDAELAKRILNNK